MSAPSALGIFSHASRNGTWGVRPGADLAPSSRYSAASARLGTKAGVRGVCAGPASLPSPSSVFTPRIDAHVHACAPRLQAPRNSPGTMQMCTAPWHASLAAFAAACVLGDAAVVRRAGFAVLWTARLTPFQILLTRTVRSCGGRCGRP